MTKNTEPVVNQRFALVALIVCPISLLLGAFVEFSREIEGSIYGPNSTYCRVIRELNRLSNEQLALAKAHSQKALQLLKEKKYDLSAEEYSLAIKLNPTDQNLYLDRGEADLLSFDFNEATKDYTKALELDPGNANAYCGLAIVHERSGDPTKAIELYDKAVASDPTYAIAYNNRARLKERLGDSSYKEDDKRAEDLGYPEKWVTDFRPVTKNHATTGE
ncbi:MAG TPA: tetratricopeptide repeat protein [Candidatus Melainabacteria bacterium]|nr:tetratricopeptide repeat protein [Candidatus Melainabacteria bacterium]HMP52453.1 tetratricopeptide repeat protein [Candidatus Melainabacteria bacterium]